MSNPKHTLRYRWLVNLLRQPLAEQWLLVQVYLLLGVTRLAINLLSFSQLEPFLGRRLVESGSSVSGAHLHQAQQIGWAIRTVSPYTPWQSNCFSQALTAKILLQRRGIPTTLYMGVAFQQAEELGVAGHVWLRCGPLYVTGGDENKRLEAITAFSE